MHVGGLLYGSPSGEGKQSCYWVGEGEGGLFVLGISFGEVLGSRLLR